MCPSRFYGIYYRSKAFFFEKKKQKTFAFWRTPLGFPRQRIKVFCFFFSKKKFFLAFLKYPYRFRQARLDVFQERPFCLAFLACACRASQAT